jgi:hypothetical protein
LDDRRYQDLLDEALARIPVHNPDWTNFNKSDPGVTLLELFAFLTENLLYRGNLIPERNRRKFLSLLGIPLRPASSSRGIVVIRNERGPLAATVLNSGVEVRAGQVPFRTERGLDVLPVDSQAYYKKRLENPPASLVAYYQQLYASFSATPPAAASLQLYETAPMPEKAGEPLDLSQTVDRSIWIALLARKNENPDEVREALVNRVVSLGIVPALATPGIVAAPGSQAQTAQAQVFQYEIPKPPPGGALPSDPAQRRADYHPLTWAATNDVTQEPGIVELRLPAQAEQLGLWTNLDPLEAGAGDFPPALEDTALSARLVTWLRIRATAAVDSRILWAGINATFVKQRTRVLAENLPNGTGEPDQSAALSKRPVLPGSVKIAVTANNATTIWSEIEDLYLAGPEAPAPDLRLPPGAAAPQPGPVEVFTLDAEAGVIRFGDGAHGKRPPAAALMRADYDYGLGQAGNVEAGSIASGPALPAGFKVTNPVRTWGGADAESAADGEKQIARYLQHRDRLVNADDFRTITLRTPGVDVGRVEVLPAWHPDISPNEPGDVPGTVTLMLVPRYDPLSPDAPEPTEEFLRAVCAYLDPRRLITTELVLRGPIYRPIYISAGITAIPGASQAEVIEAVRSTLRRFLSPLPPGGGAQGWPLRKPVIAQELLAVASRVPGVQMVNQLFLALATGPALTQAPMSGLELPRLAGITVVQGDARDIDQVRGLAPAGLTPGASTVPVPIIPETCR